MTVSRTFCIGTKGTGPGQGIWRYQHRLGSPWGDRSPDLLVEAPASHFLAFHPSAERLYAVAEGTDGSVASFDVNADCMLRPTATVATGGAAPCHLLVHPFGQWLYAANYGNGVLTAIPLDEAGDVTEDVLTYHHSGSGPHPKRQQGSHAHFTAISQDGAWLIVTDLGTDQLRAYPLDQGRPIDDPVLTALPPGCGPRHLVVSPGFLYVAGELSGEIVTLAWDEQQGQGQVVDRCAASTREGDHFLSHIERHHDHLVVGVRGSNTLSTLRIRSDATPELVQEVATAAWPRHLAVAEGAVIVAGEGADVLAVHPLTEAGAGEVSAEVAVPGPMCVLPL
ncbi:lactonase family protein [Ruania alba]|uniref:6-phosphogluconolactonase, cycloisomerase 2 family n=1 Tax=Ruania alba TaxID=648782 RepID=A0A1H5MST1_9MICO|nr:beta-propeller fold lactonase family protein [Ruania alba]SEE92230.1 6-phosphogluconolactonase, cycloisomerase 2 family [Ruania alba]